MEIPDQNQHVVDLLTVDENSQAHLQDQGCVLFCLCICNGLLGVGTGRQLGVELS